VWIKSKITDSGHHGLSSQGEVISGSHLCGLLQFLLTFGSDNWTLAKMYGESQDLWSIGVVGPNDSMDLNNELVRVGLQALDISIAWIERLAWSGTYITALKEVHEARL
jgi:hypothetical protein